MLKRLLFASIIVMLFAACEKEAGEGGTSEIRGKVYVLDYNADMMYLLKEYYAPEEDVYIIYGDDDIYTERFRTNYDGSFVFRYLRKGKYKIFAYSKNLEVEAGVEPVFVEVEITKDNQVVELPSDIVIKK
jgi:hypothetical protein